MCRFERRRERVAEVLAGVGEANLAMAGIDERARFEVIAGWCVGIDFG
jgi:hypothetical protein